MKFILVHTCKGLSRDQTLKWPVCESSPFKVKLKLQKKICESCVHSLHVYKNEEKTLTSKTTELTVKSAHCVAKESF